MRITLALFLLLASSISLAQSLKLSPNFGGMEYLDLFHEPFPFGDNAVSGKLSKSNTAEQPIIHNICEPDGGSPTAGSIVTIPAKNEHGDILAITCEYQISHTGLGIKGALYETRTYEIKNGKITPFIQLDKILSGYEGSSEDGHYSYHFYNTNLTIKQKLNQLLKQKHPDSLALAHTIIIERLKDRDIEAIAYYLKDELIENLGKKHPLTKKNAALYNDIGFALIEAGKNKQALKTLLPIEKVAPTRTVLFLNIADAYWPTDRDKARTYYKKYTRIMRGMNKEDLIPQRVNNRTN